MIFSRACQEFFTKYPLESAYIKCTWLCLPMQCFPAPWTSVSFPGYLRCLAMHCLFLLQSIKKCRSNIYFNHKNIRQRVKLIFLSSKIPPIINTRWQSVIIWIPFLCVCTSTHTYMYVSRRDDGSVKAIFREVISNCWRRMMPDKHFFYWIIQFTNASRQTEETWLG